MPKQIEIERANRSAAKIIRKQKRNRAEQIQKYKIQKKKYITSRSELPRKTEKSRNAFQVLGVMLRL